MQNYLTPVCWHCCFFSAFETVLGMPDLRITAILVWCIGQIFIESKKGENFYWINFAQQLLVHCLCSNRKPCREQELFVIHQSLDIDLGFISPSGNKSAFFLKGCLHAATWFYSNHNSVEEFQLMLIVLTPSPVSSNFSGY